MLNEFIYNKKYKKMEQLVYKGFIKESSKDENDNALFIGNMEEPIAYVFMDELQSKQVSIRYFISETEKTKKELKENMLMAISGAVNADYGDSYSDYTGYLWTDENLNVGNHNLILEIKDNVGKFIYMEVDVYN